MLSEYAKNKGIDFQQYLLKGQTILDLDAGPLKGMSFTSYYLKFLTTIPDDVPKVQRQKFEAKMQEYLNKGVEMLKQKNIL
jgi:hypothetical protein